MIRHRRWGATMVLWLAAGCTAGAPGAQAPPAPAPRVAPSEPSAPEGLRLFAGEHFEAQISRGLFTVGSVELDVGARCTLAGVVVLPSQSHAERTGLYGSFKPGFVDTEAWHDLETGLPLWAHSNAETSKRRIESSTRFGHGYFHWEYRSQSKLSGHPAHERQGTQALPPGAWIYDGHAALGALRSLRGPTDQQTVLYLALGRRLWRLELNVTSRQTVSLAGDDYPARRIEGTALRLSSRLRTVGKPRHFVIWISDDDDRLPMRARLERKQSVIELELSSYHRQPPDDAAGLQPCSSEW